MSAVTLALGVLAVGALVYAVGVDESREAAARAGSGVKRGATSGVAAGAAGAGLGLQFGDQLLNAILAEPGFALAAVTGFLGALGTGGFLGDITAVQFLLIGVVVFIGAFAVFRGDD
ncbi:hypothetical protein DJ79_05095 [Halorubrum ezzemoulense]|uniref:Uncharacterized protein n=1 Tax=Halorubrum ezzemoulense TaxID=337243 RepID=A0A256JJM4_HALEZ|nr:hypothetical protein [Halorubrum ezzemoulense]OYR68756.1 hypothetical protein DJ79_05095 [Halorubrum ezzemoulense]